MATSARRSRPQNRKRPTGRTPNSARSAFNNAAKSRLTAPRRGRFRFITPGAGAYDLPGSFERAKRKEGPPVGGLAKKKPPHFVSPVRDTPGPGAHDHVDPHRPLLGKGSKGIAMSRAHRLVRQRGAKNRRSRSQPVGSPGPGAYDIKDATPYQQKGSCGAVWGRQRKKFSLAKKHPTPGPGAHEVVYPHKPIMGKGPAKVVSLYQSPRILLEDLHYY